jgi:hypothetical protein
VEEKGVDPCQINEFDCSAVHWIGISPQSRAKQDGAGLLPLVKWLAKQPGINFQHRQRQGHTPLHKAAWGGHIELIRYLRDEHGLLDETQDYAGNYAADLADMAHTTRHTEVAQFLRQECSAARSQSCAILGVPVGSSVSDIRKAYLAKVRQVHPDRQHDCTNSDFDAIRRAYEHLTVQYGIGSQSNPAHTLNLMLELSKTATNESTFDGQGELDDGDCFKARLIAVLLEYGDKGLDLRCVLDFSIGCINFDGSHLRFAARVVTSKRSGRKCGRTVPFRMRPRATVKKERGDCVTLLGSMLVMLWIFCSQLM